MSDAQIDDRPAAPVQRYTRRLSDKILIAFHQACDQGDFQVAERLLTVLEVTMTRAPTPPKRRRDVDSLVMAHERLWNLRHPAVDVYRTFG
jgi:hypothetical protein